MLVHDVVRGFHMTIDRLLAERKDEFVDKWCDAIFSTYPEETQKIWRVKRDPFSNPVGKAIRDGALAIFDQVLAWNDAEAVADALVGLVKIRAVQDFSPSQALRFVYLFKKVLRDMLLDSQRKSGSLEELMHFESRIDNLAMMAFDIYSKERELIFDLRCREIKNGQKMLLKRAKMIVDVSADPAD